MADENEPLHELRVNPRSQWERAFLHQMNRIERRAMEPAPGTLSPEERADLLAQFDEAVSTDTAQIIRSQEVMANTAAAFGDSRVRIGSRAAEALSGLAGEGRIQLNPPPRDVQNRLLSYPFVATQRPERRPSEEGTKIHLTTRDGFRKMIRFPGLIGEYIAIPRNQPSRSRWDEATISRQEFKITRKAVYTDYETGRSTTEYWAVER